MIDVKERARYYLRSEIMVHIECGERFYNGYIVGLSEKKIVLEDRKLGKIPLFFSEIDLVERFTSKTKEDFQ